VFDYNVVEFSDINCTVFSTLLHMINEKRCNYVILDKQMVLYNFCNYFDISVIILTFHNIDTLFTLTTKCV